MPPEGAVRLHSLRRAAAMSHDPTDRLLRWAIWVCLLLAAVALILAIARVAGYA